MNNFIALPSLHLSARELAPLVAKDLATLQRSRTPLLQSPATLRRYCTSNREGLHLFHKQTCNTSTTILIQPFVGSGGGGGVAKPAYGDWGLGFFHFSFCDTYLGRRAFLVLVYFSLSIIHFPKQLAGYTQILLSFLSSSSSASFTKLKSVYLALFQTVSW